MIRELEKEDYKEFISLLKQIINIDRHICSEEFWYLYGIMKQHNSIIYIYEIDEKIIGTCKINYEIKFFDNVVHFEDVIINKQHRRHGYGTEMINQIIEIIPKCYKAVLQCKDELSPFYSNCGFILEGKHLVKRT